MADRVHDTDQQIYKRLKALEMPVLLVFTRADNDIESKVRRVKVPAEATQDEQEEIRKAQLKSKREDFMQTVASEVEDKLGKEAAGEVFVLSGQQLQEDDPKYHLEEEKFEACLRITALRRQAKGLNSS